MSQERLHIVLISSWFPYPPDNGSRLRAYNILKILAANYDVTLLAFTAPDFQKEHADALRAMCREIRTTPYIPFRPDGARALAAFFSPKPRFLVDVYSSEMQRLLDTVLAVRGADVIIAGELAATPYVRPEMEAGKIFDDLETAIYHDAFTKAHGPSRVRNALTWQKLARYLRTRSRVFDVMTVVSKREWELARQIGIPESRLYSLPNGIDFDANSNVPVLSQKNSLIYSGALTYTPNRDAMYYFVREILPLVKNSAPDVQMRITGRADQVAINELSVDNAVLFTGYVPDIRPLIAGSRVCVVPLRQGAGTRLKVLEAMALGTPVVSTPKGVEGLDLVPDLHVLIADTPLEFTRHILNLLRDPALYEHITKNAQAHVKQHYNWTILGDQLVNLVEAVTQRNRNGNA